MAVVTTLDIAGLTAEDYGHILDRIGVEKRPAGGIYQHIAHATDNGYRIIEIWDDKAGFELFLKDTLFPAAQALKIQRAGVPASGALVPGMDYFRSGGTSCFRVT